MQDHQEIIYNWKDTLEKGLKGRHTRGVLSGFVQHNNKGFLNCLNSMKSFHTPSPRVQSEFVHP